MTGCGEGMREILQPVRVGTGIVVDIGDDVARGGAQTRVPGAAQAAVLRPDQRHVARAHNVGRRVR